MLICSHDKNIAARNTYNYTEKHKLDLHFFISTYYSIKIHVLAITEKLFRDDLQLWLSLDVLNIAVTVAPEMMLPKQHPPPLPLPTLSLGQHQQMALKILQVEKRKCSRSKRSRYESWQTNVHLRYWFYNALEQGETRSLWCHNALDHARRYQCLLSWNPPQVSIINN